jgi:hypothetical protein
MREHMADGAGAFSFERGKHIVKFKRAGEEASKKIPKLPVRGFPNAISKKA